MQNPGLDEAQAGIKVAGRNISNLMYADNTTLMAEIEEELKSLLMKMKEESVKVGLKLSIQKKEDNGIQSHHFMANRGKKVQTVTDFTFWGSTIIADGDCSHEIKRRLSCGSKL